MNWIEMLPEMWNQLIHSENSAVFFHSLVYFLRTSRPRLIGIPDNGGPTVYILEYIVINSNILIIVFYFMFEIAITLIRGTSRWVSQKWKNKNTIYIYFGLLGHLHLLLETEKYRIFWGVLYEGGGERTREGGQNMCQTLNNRRGYWGRTQTKNGAKLMNRAVWINFSCTLLPISKKERY